MTARVLIALVLGAALGLSACGSSDGGSSTTTAKPATSAPRTLTSSGYRALAAFLDLSSADLSPARFAERCDSLGRSAYDDEVGAIREVCVTVSDIAQASSEMRSCNAKTSTDVLAARRCTADGLDRVAAYASDAVDAIRAVAKVNGLATGACRSYLLDPREIERFQDFARTARSTARAMRDTAASQTRLQQAANRLEIASRRFERTARAPSAERAAAKACRPS